MRHITIAAACFLALIAVWFALPATSVADLVEPSSIVLPAAPATVPAVQTEDISGIADQAIKATRAGDYRLLVASILSALIWGLRRFGTKLVPFLGTDRGGAVLAVFLGLASVVAGELVNGNPLTPGVLVNGLSMALTAAGGWAVLRKIVSPADKKTPA